MTGRSAQRGAATALLGPQYAVRRNAAGIGRSRRDGGDGVDPTATWRVGQDGMACGGHAGSFRAIDHPAGGGAEGRTAHAGGVVSAKRFRSTSLRGTAQHEPGRDPWGRALHEPPRGLGTDLAVITELATRLVHGARFTAEPRTVYGEASSLCATRRGRFVRRVSRPETTDSRHGNRRHATSGA
jgi:hypothetical protein